MKKVFLIMALTVLPLAVSACDKPADTPKAEEPADAMGNMAMPTNGKMAQGSGTVTAIDLAAGKITLEHGAIPAVDWPAMTMGFSAKPDLLKDIAIGDKVDFDLTVTGNAGEVTAIKKQ